MSERQTLVLVDGHALAFRAFHALAQQGLRSTTGEPTYAVFGFFQILLTELQHIRPEYVAVSFDVGRTFRHVLYAEYKGNRGDPPEEFRPQLERIKQVLRALNIPIYTAENYEADDVIGTLARQAAAQGVETIILTGDTDTLQLVDELTKVLLANPHKGNSTMLYDEEQVRTRYEGLAPAQLADLRGLKGDTSDNIPGIPGIGEKTAISLLNQFGSVENIFQHLDEVAKRFRSKLEGQEQAARFSAQLATIDCKAPVTLHLPDTVLREYDREAVVKMFRELEFRSLEKKLPVPVGSGVEQVALPDDGQPRQLTMFDVEAVRSAPQSALVDMGSAPQGDYRIADTEETLDELIRELEAAPVFAFDSEISGLRPLQDELVGISVSTAPGTGWYVPVGHQTDEPQLPLEVVVHRLRPFFQDPQKARVAHNAKFDIEVLTQVGIEVPSVAFETMVAAALLGYSKLGLKDLAYSQLDMTMTEIEELIGRGKSQITMAQVPIARAAPYACADADATLRLMHLLQPQLAAADQEKVRKIFTEMELPLIPVLVDMERAGITLNVEYLRELGQFLGEKLKDIADDIYKIAEGPFNINSGAQLEDVLFKKLNIPTTGLGKTKTGRLSLTADVLEGLKDNDPTGIIDLILEHRQLTKLKSTYVDALPELVDPRTGRVHTSFNQVGAATGRLSSTAPNLQNIPIRTDVGRQIRRAFVAAEGHHLLAVDYSQVELRVLAHVTQDENLVDAFKTNMDIHTATASRIFGVEPGQVTKDQRRISKMTVFGIVYGISSFGLAQRTDLSRSEAQQMIDSLFEQFPTLRTYIDSTIEEAGREGYVHTLFGRRRYFPELRDGGGGPRQQAAKREAINAPIQGTSADLIKLAMVKLHQELRSRKCCARLLLQVHDELLLEVPDDELDDVRTLVCEVMENIYPDMRVPLKVDVEQGKNWEEMAEV